VLAGIAGGYFVVWKLVLEPNRAVQTPAQLAEERQELETAEAREEIASEGSIAPLADPGSQTGTGPQVASGNVDDVPYSTSFPAMQVAVGTSDTPASAEPDEVPGGAGEGDNVDPHAIADDSASTTAPDDSESTPPPSTPPASSPAEPVIEPDTSTSTTPAPEASSDDDEELEVPSGATVYHIYAGSYNSRSDADRYKEQLATLGFQASVVVIESESRADYLLRITTLEDYAAAGALKAKLVDSGFGSAFVTRQKQ
jgi:cell division protein FtsN